MMFPRAFLLFLGCSWVCYYSLCTPVSTPVILNVSVKLCVKRVSFSNASRLSTALRCGSRFLYVTHTCLPCWTPGRHQGQFVGTVQGLARRQKHAMDHTFAPANDLIEEPDVLMDMLHGVPNANGAAAYWNGGAAAGQVVPDVAPPSSIMPLEQLAQFGAQHEPQLAMELFYGTPLYHQQAQPPAPHMQQSVGTYDPIMAVDPMYNGQHSLHSNGSTLASEAQPGISAPMPASSGVQPTKSNRGRKPLPRTVEERIQATQEKNRRAQRKFR